MLSPVILVIITILSPAAGTTCFGKDPDFDQQCAAFKDEATCDEQLGCIWGEAGKTNCFASNGDPAIEKLCETITNATQCAEQVACTWRSDADKTRWIESIETGVTALGADAPTIPTSISVQLVSHSSLHDHKEVAVADLSAMLNAWVTKYALPASVVDGLRALVATESVNYNTYHVALGGGAGSVDEFAAGGRNWGGMISLAFVRAQATSSITMYYKGLTCQDIGFWDKSCLYSDGKPTPEGAIACSSDADCTHVRMSMSSRALDATEAQAAVQQLEAWSYPYLSSENVLLKAEITGGGVTGTSVLV